MGDKIYRFAEKVGRFYSQPEKARGLIREINDICDSKEGLRWNQLPDVDKLVQLKPLVRFSAPYSRKDELERTFKWKNMDIRVLEHVKRRLVERDYTEPSFLRVYKIFKMHVEAHNELPDDGYIIRRMLPELASVQAREVDAEWRRHENSSERTLDAHNKRRDKTLKIIEYQGDI